MDKSPFDAVGALYDSIGHGYSAHRRQDPFLYRRILSSLGDAQTVVNVGAGTGSYEPSDRTVLAIEPSEVMARQRRADSLPAIRAPAYKLPLHDRSVDSAMTVMSLQHWQPHQFAGVREMGRVARKRVIIVTIDPRVSAQMWLMADYVPEIAKIDHQTFPLPETICGWLDCETEIEAIPVSRDFSDWMLLSFWAHPERVLDPAARAATSAFARQPETVIERVVVAVRHDIEDGSWNRRYASLQSLREYDAGLRLITARLT